MIINFHTDPLDYPRLIQDLTTDGAAVIDATRVHFGEVHRGVRGLMNGVLAFSVASDDRDWHHYLIDTTIVEYEAGETDCKILQAVGLWCAAGRPVPHRIKI